jgi:predicted ATPase
MALEDLHWADPDTLTVAEYLADNLASVPVLCVATSRSEPASAAMDMIAAHLSLDRLPGGQVAAMIRACVPGAGDDVVARVQRTADGVPFLVEEVLASRCRRPAAPRTMQVTQRTAPGGRP